MLPENCEDQIQRAKNNLSKYTKQQPSKTYNTQFITDKEKVIDKELA